MPRAFSANRILAKLSAEDCRTLAAHLKPVFLPAGEQLWEEGAPLKYACFPLDCMISMVTVTEPGATLEVGLVGREGMAGVGLALGVSKAHARAVVQSKGNAIRIPAAQLLRVVGKSEALRAEIQKYAYVAMKMPLLLAACNNRHGLEARLARWLLMTRDCLSTSTFSITQRALGGMLGVRRPSVSTAASELQRRGLISYRRGVVRLLKVDALEATACKCYANIRQLIKSAA